MPNWKKLIVSGSDANLNTLSITNSGSTDDTLLLTATEDSSTAAPVATFKRNSSSPGDADYLGQLKFKGENDADQEVVYAKITAKIQDASDGSEDGLIEFANRKAGSNNITARLKSDKLQLLNGTELEVDGQVSASSFIGDGSALTGITVAQTATVAQTFSNQTSVTVDHNFNTRNVIIQTFDDNNAQVIPASVTLTSVTRATITFDSSTSGTVVVAKGGHVVSGSTQAYRQSITGASSYAVTHSLSEDYPIVQVYSSSRAQVIPSEITTTSANALDITFTSTFSGTVVVKK